ncbi:hypothetical protein [Amycolatopsis australiensis]|uniref:alpha/beta fold hydrolase n=1 Tax=Amycolatopsis australiensis TaxID=546364 RepID=UPI003182E149
MFRSSASRCGRSGSASTQQNAAIGTTTAALAFVRLTTHYYAHAAWLEEGAVIRDAGRLAGIPGVLIYGRLDLSCPVSTAVELAEAWPGAELLVDDHSGHRASDLKRGWKLAALDRFAR